MFDPQPKPRTRASEKASARRAEVATITEARKIVFAEDVCCRFPDTSRESFPCDGPDELAHLSAFRRSKTGGRSATDRHPVRGLIRLCRIHHQSYDRYEYAIQPIGPDGSRGPCVFVDLRNGVVLGRS